MFISWESCLTCEMRSRSLSGVDYPWVQCSGEAQGMDSMNSSLSCSLQIYFGKSPPKNNWNSPNNTSPLRLFLLVLWRVTSKQRPELSSQKKVQFLCYYLFFWKWNLWFPAGSWSTVSQQVFPPPQAQLLPELHPNSNPGPWGKFQAVSRTFISAIKAIRQFWGRVLTQQGTGVCCTRPELLHHTEVMFSVQLGFDPVS